MANVPFDEVIEKQFVVLHWSGCGTFRTSATRTTMSVRGGMVEFGLNTIEIVRRAAEKTGYPLQIRVGIHTGSTIGGVIGRHKMTYDYLGRTVNLASRLESLSEPNRVHISELRFGG